MARIAIVTDVHLGNRSEFGRSYIHGINDRGRSSLATLEFAVGTANSRDCHALISLGDLFDSDRPEPPIIKEALRILEEAPPVTLLLGNHEMRTTDRGDHSLGPMYPIADVIDVAQVIQVGHDYHDHPVDLLFVPFEPGPAEEWLPERVAELDDYRREDLPAVLAIHLGIADNETPGYLSASDDSIGVGRLRELCHKHTIDAVIAGNWHERKEWGGKCFVQQVGCLCPTDFRNPGTEDYGWMGLLESHEGGRLSYKSIRVPGPRFVQVRDVEEISEYEIDPGHSLYVEATVPPMEMEDARKELIDLLDRDAIAGFRVRSDGSEEVAAKSRVKRVRSAGTVEEALASFVQELVYTGSISKERLIEIAKEYLGL